MPSLLGISMEIKLKQIAKSLGKSITDIAKETDLNRNTVTALYHGKVDGIRFDTIEKLCDTYDLQVEDILSYKKKEKGLSDKKEGSISVEDYGEPYKQEAPAAPIYLFPAFKGSGLIRVGNTIYGKHKAVTFYKKGYVEGYWQKDLMNKYAKAIYQDHKSRSKIDNIFEEFSITAEEIERIYRNLSENRIPKNKSDLESLIKDVFKAYNHFWNWGLFIDLFDAGFDTKTIEEIATRNSLSQSEVETLITSTELTFGDERLFMLFGFAKELASQKKTRKEDIKRFVENDTRVKEYKESFDYYKSNYYTIKHIENQEVVKDLENILNDIGGMESEHKRLSTYGKVKQKQIQNVLKKHKTNVNPLYFFQVLTFWREFRKKINLMGLHCIDTIVLALEEQYGVPREDLIYLTEDELSQFLLGFDFTAQLKKRKEKGLIVFIEDDDYRVIEGEEAQSLRNDLEEIMNGDKKDELTIRGQVASQGYAKGRARVILNEKDFSKFKEGEILVTGMTRPEFVPLMKMASGIVTNEGGITCHAAIVSRELRKPCIIGTQKATQTIKDGDLVEVRAHHGTVRILQNSATYHATYK